MSLADYFGVTLVRESTWAAADRIDPEAAVAWDRDHPHDEAQRIEMLGRIIAVLSMNGWWLWLGQLSSLHTRWFSWNSGINRALIVSHFASEQGLHTEYTQVGTLVVKGPNNRRIVLDGGGTHANHYSSSDGWDGTGFHGNTDISDPLQIISVIKWVKGSDA